MSAQETAQETQLIDDGKPIGIGAYISFILAVVFFSGLCYTEEWWGIFDFVVLNGDAGSLVANVKQTAEGITTSMGSFRGKGGSGAIDGFLFAISIVPAIMFSVAMIEVFDHYGATRAAGRLLNPILKPLMGIPGTTALALIASLQSTDAGAALTRSLADHKIINDKETKIFAAFQMAADAGIGNFLASGIALFVLVLPSGQQAMPVSLGLCLGMILIGKVLAANIMRLILIRKK